MSARDNKLAAALVEWSLDPHIPSFRRILANHGLAVVPVDADAQRQADLKLLAAHFGGEDAWKREAARIAAWGRKHLPVEIYEFVGTTADGVMAMHRAMLVAAKEDRDDA